MDERWPEGHRELLRCVADGRIHEVAARTGEVRLVDPAVADLAEADASAQAGSVGLPDLRDLHARVVAEAGDRPLLGWWAAAILGERAFLDADLGGVPLAVQALHETPDDPFPALPLLYVRGRLRRIAAAAYVVAPSPDGLVEHRRLRDLAVTDFLRGGFTAEVAVTRGVSAALHAIFTWDDVLEDLEVVRDARTLLGDAPGSLWGPMLDYLLGLVALTAGDVAALDAAGEAMRGRRSSHPVFAPLADMCRALHALVVSDGSARSLAALAAAGDELRRTHPHLLQLSHLHAANLLADMGRAEDARRFGVAGLDWPPPVPAMGVVADVLRVRLDILDGVVPDHDEVLALLEHLEGLGLRRRAGAFALRLARDLARVGDTVEAERFRAWGLDRMPTHRRRTLWEQRWGAPVVAGSDAAGTSVPAAGVAVDAGAGSSGEVLEVRVMAPMLDVLRAGRPVPLRTMAAKLLLALIVAYPDPLHVEQAVDVLWPEAGPGVGRDRLNTVLHRLRAGLGVGAGAVRRSGDVLVLAADDWDVDLFRWRGQLAGSDPLSGAALRGATGNLCHVQFPYDDLFVEARRAVAAAAVRALGSDARTVDLDAGERDRLGRLFEG